MGKREHIYKIIAENIRKERRRLGITQAELAERADVSLDTIKSVENGRRAMSLDTYLNIVHALESSPTVLMSQQHPEKHIERFAFMMNRCDEREIEFALHMIEQIFKYVSRLIALLPFSTLLIVSNDTSARSASSACVIPSLLRSFLIFSAIILYMCSLFPIAPSSFLTYRIISEIIMGFRKL